MRKYVIPLLAVAMLAAPSGAPAAIDASVTGDQLRVTGDAADEEVTIGLRTPGGDVRVTAIDDTFRQFVFSQDAFASVAVQLGDGDDAMSVDLVNGDPLGGKEATYHLGRGDDFARGGAGDETLIGSAGEDLLQGHEGEDVLEGGTGPDDFTWDPGDGSDVLDGGGDSDLDELDFDGAAGAERFDLEPVGTDVRLRGAGGPDLTLERLDLLDLETFGGDDTIAAAEGVGSLVHLRIDAGQDDDEVVTPEGDQHIVGGGSEDEIDAGAGSDRIFGDGGRDLLEGGSGDDGVSGGPDDDFVFGGPDTDGCAGGFGLNVVSECESSTLPPDLVPTPFDRPLEPDPEAPIEDRPPSDPAPAPGGPPSDGVPATELPAAGAGFEIDAIDTRRAGLRVTVRSTSAVPVDVELSARESVRANRRERARRVVYAPVTRELEAGAAATVALKAPKRARGRLRSAVVRRSTVTVTNVATGISESKKARSRK